MLIHVHPRLVLHGDEFKVRVALRALVVRMHQALCALGGHDYLQRVADNRIFLQCVSCGHETPGWRIDIARRGWSTRGVGLFADKSEQARFT